jgi:cobalamin biosynthesis protein CobW
MGLNLHEEDTIQLAHEHLHHGPVESLPSELDRPLLNQSQFDGHQHTGLGAHEHSEQTHEHFHEHDTGWQSFVLRTDHAQDADQLKTAIREVTLQQPILRAKGFASVAGKEPRLVVQAVRNRVQTYFERESPNVAESSIVFIGYHPNRKTVMNLLNQLTKTEWH